MNLFEAVKAAVTPHMAAERYGLQVRQGSMTCCPFHIVGANSISLAPPSTAELVLSVASPLPAKSYDFAGTLWTPSMKLNKDYFYCFGCGAHGDLIALAAQLFDIPPADAAKKLAADFGITDQKPSVLAKLKRGKSQAELESRSFRVLGDYLQILRDWKAHCAAQSPKDDIDPRYAEACHMLERIENMLGILTCGTPKERAEVVDDLQKDNRLALMEARNRQIREGEHRWADGMENFQFTREGGCNGKNLL